MSVKFETNVRKNQKDIRSGTYTDPYLMFQVRDYKPDTYTDPNWIEQKDLMNVDYQDQRVRNLDTRLYRFGAKHHVDQEAIFNPDTKMAYNKGTNPYNVNKPSIPVKGTKLYYPKSVNPSNDYTAFNLDNPNFSFSSEVPSLTKPKEKSNFNLRMPNIQPPQNNFSSIKEI